MSLEELYMPYNNLKELFDISFLDKLVVLDLECNKIDQIEELRYLQRCKNLKYLTLEGNPVSKTHEIFSYIWTNFNFLE